MWFPFTTESTFHICLFDYLKFKFIGLERVQIMFWLLKCQRVPLESQNQNKKQSGVKECFSIGLIHTHLLQAYYYFTILTIRAAVAFVHTLASQSSHVFLLSFSCRFARPIRSLPVCVSFFLPSQSSIFSCLFSLVFLLLFYFSVFVWSVKSEMWKSLPSLLIKIFFFCAIIIYIYYRNNEGKRTIFNTLSHSFP